MTDSWLQPRRLLLVSLGALTVFFLMAPTLVVVPMSITASNALTFPPEGFSIGRSRRPPSSPVGPSSPRPSPSGRSTSVSTTPWPTGS